MKLAYYPGCTLKTKARNLEDSALAALKALSIEVKELDRWNCCGAVFSLADDDLIHHIAPVRNLIRAQEEGCEGILTLCSQCYNTLARAHNLMIDDEEKRDTINRFMDEEPDYKGEVQVIHYLTYLRDHVGWDALREKVKTPLRDLRVAPFYGCSLLRPDDVAIEKDPTILEEFLSALGAQTVSLTEARECCGSYQSLANPDAEQQRLGKIFGAVNRSGANAIALSCPMCEYNLGRQQHQLLEQNANLTATPTYYFTQLLAVALGIEAGVCHFDLNGKPAFELLKEKSYIVSAAS